MSETMIALIIGGVAIPTLLFLLSHRSGETRLTAARNARYLEKVKEARKALAGPLGIRQIELARYSGGSPSDELFGAYVGIYNIVRRHLDEFDELTSVDVKNVFDNLTSRFSGSVMKFASNNMRDAEGIKRMFDTTEFFRIKFNQLTDHIEKHASSTKPIPTFMDKREPELPVAQSWAQDFVVKNQ